MPSTDLSPVKGSGAAGRGATSPTTSDAGWALGMEEPVKQLWARLQGELKEMAEAVAVQSGADDDP